MNVDDDVESSETMKKTKRREIIMNRKQRLIKIVFVLRKSG
jgi:hypothetical protein